MQHRHHRHGDAPQTREDLIKLYSGSGRIRHPDYLEKALDAVFTVQDKEMERPRAVDVANVLLPLGVDEVTIVATLLSEPRLRGEAGYDKAFFQQQFGDVIADVTEQVTWLNTFKECRTEQATAPEQAENLRRMLLSVVNDVRAVLIKLAFRVQRLRHLSRHDAIEQRCIARETMDIFAPLANRLGLGQLKWELEDLSFRYLEPQTYKQIAKSLEDKRTEREVFIAQFIDMVKLSLQRLGISAEVSGRPKHIYSIWRKMRRKQVGIDELFDLLAVRIIVENNSKDDCYKVFGQVHDQWKSIPQEFDDYIGNPKENGYQSLHTAVIGPSGRVVEVQIRTRDMHEFAENGVAAHWRYKEGGDSDLAMEQAIGSLRRLLENQNDEDLLDDFRSDIFPNRVFVLTPQGDVVDLIKGATPLDFAYHIHTEIGHSCVGVKINGSIKNLNYTLQSGDRVEIITQRNRTPTREWLNANLGYLQTHRARSRVRQWFRQQDREQNLADGRAILNREVYQLGLEKPDTLLLADKLNLRSSDDVLLGLGRGDIGVPQLIRLLNLQEPEVFQPQNRPTGHDPKLGQDEIYVNGVGNVLTHLAQCCAPVPGDDIIGFISKGEGVKIHRRDCANILNLSEKDQKRLVDVSWGVGKPEKAFNVNLEIEAFDRQGLLRDITAVLANEGVNVHSANTATNPIDQSVSMKLGIEVNDQIQLSRVIDRVSQLHNVFDVVRKAS